MLNKINVDSYHYNIDDLESIEKQSGKKYELIEGSIYAMAGASIEHGILVHTMGTLLGNIFQDKPCVVVNESLKLKIQSGKNDNIFLPDIGVICDPVIENKGYYENPIVLVEVLSKSTKYKDRTLKLFSYMKVSSLLCYLLVEQDKQRIECYKKINDDISYLIYEENEIININDNISISVNDVYKDLNKFRKFKKC